MPLLQSHPVMADKSATRRLATYRLERDLTFDALAAEMTAAGFPMGVRALHYALTHRTTRPRERTRYKIEQFVATLGAPRKLPRRRPSAAREARP